MKFSDLLKKDLTEGSYINNMDTLIIDMIAIAKDKGLTSLPISKVEQVLHKNGMNLPVNFLSDFLQQKEDLVAEILPGSDVITFATDDVDTDNIYGDTEAQQKHISNNAMNTVKKDQKQNSSGSKLEL